MQHEELTPFGQLTITKIDGVTGKTETQIVPNLIVTSGKNYIAAQMMQTPNIAKMNAMALGTGTVAPVVGDTRLGAELATTQYVGGVRPTFETNANPARTNNVLTYTAVFGPVTGAASATVTEAGIFNSTAVSNNTTDSGIMLSRTTFGTVTKTALDTITITWTITIN